MDYEIIENYKMFDDSKPCIAIEASENGKAQFMISPFASVAEAQAEIDERRDISTKSNTAKTEILQPCGVGEITSKRDKNYIF